MLATYIFHKKLGVIEIRESNHKIISINFLKKAVYSKETPLLKECKAQVEEYLFGARKNFDLNKLNLDINGSDFEKKVWNEILKVEYGNTKSYGEIAEKIGGKNYSRAVGKASGKNKIAIIIPCHRIIGSTGKLVGYYSGVNRKKYLLDLEKSKLLK